MVLPVIGALSLLVEVVEDDTGQNAAFAYSREWQCTENGIRRPRSPNYLDRDCRHFGLTD